MSLLEAETGFGLSLLQHSAVNSSFVFSPLSIALALSLVHAGAKGTTKSQITNALAKGSSDGQLVKHYSELANGFRTIEEEPWSVQTYLANRAYLRNGFNVNPSYLATIKKDYDALAISLDFAKNIEAAKVMNDFVSKVTKGKITDLVKADTVKDSVTILINALYLKAQWSSVFHKEDSKEDKFFVSATNTRTETFMRDEEVHRDYTENAEVQVLSLAYSDGRYAFNIFLPKDKLGLDKFRAGLTGAKLQALLKKLQYTLVNIKVPKMKLETELDLKTTLKAIGVTDVFEPTADLTGIAPGVRVSEVSHKAIIEVNEDGTVAAAATMIGMVGGAAPQFGEPPKPIEFKADHPFLFVLTKEQHPLFMGIYR